MGFKDDQKELFQRILDQVVTPEELAKYGIASNRPMTKAEIISWHLANRACLGDLNAIKELFDRLLGKPAQSITAEVKQTTYVDFLMKIAKEEGITKKVIEVEPDPPKALPPGYDLLGDLA